MRAPSEEKRHIYGVQTRADSACFVEVPTGPEARFINVVPGVASPVAWLTFDAGDTGVASPSFFSWIDGGLNMPPYCGQ